MSVIWTLRRQGTLSDDKSWLAAFCILGYQTSGTIFWTTKEITSFHRYFYYFFIWLNMDKWRYTNFSWWTREASAASNRTKGDTGRIGFPFFPPSGRALRWNYEIALMASSHDKSLTQQLDEGSSYQATRHQELHTTKENIIELTRSHGRYNAKGLKSLTFL